MRLADIEVGGVYRYTYRGPATSAMNRHGPWLVGVVTRKKDRHLVGVSPVPGLLIARSRPPAGAHLATAPAPDDVEVSRIDGRLCHLGEWSTWRYQYAAQEEQAYAESVLRKRRAREATVLLVAALMGLDYQVGSGPWDRSTMWGQFVDDVRRRELPVLETVAAAFGALAAGRVNSDTLETATEWFDAGVR